MTEKQHRHLYELIEADQQNKARTYADWLEETHQLRERMEHDKEEELRKL